MDARQCELTIISDGWNKSIPNVKLVNINFSINKAQSCNLMHVYFKLKWERPPMLDELKMCIVHA